MKKNTLLKRISSLALACVITATSLVTPTFSMDIKEDKAVEKSAEENNEEKNSIGTDTENKASASSDEIKGEKPEQMPEKIKYTVKFTDGDTIISEREYEEGSTLEVPEEPVKDGFEFIEWTPSLSDVVNSDSTYNAVFERIEKDEESVNPDENNSELKSPSQEELSDTNSDEIVPVFEDLSEDIDIDAVLEDMELVNQEVLFAKDITVEDAEFPITLDIEIEEIKENDNVTVLHYDGEGWEIIIPDTVIDGIVTATFKSLSPVIVTRESQHEHDFIYEANEKENTHIVKCEYEDCEYSEVEDCEFNENNECIKCLAPKYIEKPEYEFEYAEFEQSINDIVVKVTGDVPVGTELIVEEKPKGLSNIEENENEVVLMVLDVKLMVDGREYEPTEYDKEVEVTFSELDNIAMGETSIYHEEELGYVEMAAEEISTEDNTEIQFTTDSFSEYCIVLKAFELKKAIPYSTITLPVIEHSSDMYYFEVGDQKNSQSYVAFCYDAGKKASSAVPFYYYDSKLTDNNVLKILKAYETENEKSSTPFSYVVCQSLVWLAQTDQYSETNMYAILGVKGLKLSTEDQHTVINAINNVTTTDDWYIYVNKAGDSYQRLITKCAEITQAKYVKESDKVYIKVFLDEIATDATSINVSNGYSGGTEADKEDAYGLYSVPYSYFESYIKPENALKISANVPHCKKGTFGMGTYTDYFRYDSKSGNYHFHADVSIISYNSNPTDDELNSQFYDFIHEAHKSDYNPNIETIQAGDLITIRFTTFNVIDFKTGGLGRISNLGYPTGTLITFPEYEKNWTGYHPKPSCADCSYSYDSSNHYYNEYNYVHGLSDEEKALGGDDSYGVNKGVWYKDGKIVGNAFDYPAIAPHLEAVGLLYNPNQCYYTLYPNAQAGKIYVKPFLDGKTIPKESGIVLGAFDDTTSTPCTLDYEGDGLYSINLWNTIENSGSTPEGLNFCMQYNDVYSPDYYSHGAEIPYEGVVSDMMIYNYGTRLTYGNDAEPLSKVFKTISYYIEDWGEPKPSTSTPYGSITEIKKKDGSSDVRYTSADRGTFFGDPLNFYGNYCIVLDFRRTFYVCDSDLVEGQDNRNLLNTYTINPVDAKYGSFDKLQPYSTSLIQEDFVNPAIGDYIYISKTNKTSGKLSAEQKASWGNGNWTVTNVNHNNTDPLYPNAYLGTLYVNGTHKFKHPDYIDFATKYAGYNGDTKDLPLTSWFVYTAETQKTKTKVTLPDGTIKEIEAGDSWELPVPEGEIWREKDSDPIKEYTKDNPIITIPEANPQPIELERYFVVTFDTHSTDMTAIPSVKVKAGRNKVAKPTVEMKKTGYKFVEWQLKGSEYDFDSSVNTNITLDAVWEKKVTVTFDSNGGDYTPTSQSIDKGTKATAPTKNPTKEHYTFDGWYSGNTKWDFTTMNVTSDITLVARWNEINWTVKFDADSTETELIPIQYVLDGQKAIAPTPAPTKTGYIFNGWYIDNGLYNTEYQFDTPVTANIDLIAKWTKEPASAPEKVTVTFNSNGGTSVPLQTITKGLKATRPSDPTRSGYTFDYWTLNGNRYDFTQAVNGNITLVAKWTENSKPTPTKYTVVFKDYNGTIISSKQYEKGDTVIVPTSPTRNGYTFKGWTPTVVSTCKGNATYNATYTKNVTPTPDKPTVTKYAVTFKDYDGTVISKETYLKGDTIKVPSDPTRSGYEFKGWTPTVSKTCTGSVVYKATYKKKASDTPTTPTTPTKPSTPTTPEEPKTPETPTNPESPKTPETPKEDPKTPTDDVETPEPSTPKKDEPKAKTPEDSKNDKPETKTPVPEGKIPEAESPETINQDKKNEGKEIMVINELKNDDAGKASDNKKPTKELPPAVKAVIGSIITGAIGVGILAIGKLTGLWLLLANLLFVKRRKKWHGMLEEESNDFIKLHFNGVSDEEDLNSRYLVSEIAKKHTEADALQVEDYIEDVKSCGCITELPVKTQMLVTYNIGDSSETETFEEADEEKFFNILRNNMGKGTIITLNLVNTRFSVDIELEFKL